MTHIYEHFINCDMDELKSVESKNQLINSEDKYDFIRFCQNVSRERIETLLDEVGIQILLGSANLHEKINGLISCGKDFSVLKNEMICEYISKKFLPIDFSGLKVEAATDYINYLIARDKDKVANSFCGFNPTTQLQVVQNIEFDSKTANSLVIKGAKETAEYLMASDERIDLSEIRYNELYRLATKDVSIPPRLMDKRIIGRVARMDDVNKYRFLIERLKNSNDVSEIEAERKKYYLYELSTIGEDGLLEEYRIIRDEIKRTGDFSIIEAQLDDFDDNREVISELYDSGDIDATIRKLNDHKISNMVIDYLFEAVPTNVLLDMKGLINFQNQVQTLNDRDYSSYVVISNIDALSSKAKVELLHRLMDIDMVPKFYDDYSNAKDKMVEIINNSILNENNIYDFYDKELSEKYGINVYGMHGQEFYTFIKTYNNRPKNTVLSRSILDFYSDGSSFSIDGSSLLDAYEKDGGYYMIAYANVPEKQLVHIFPTDSFSNYERDEAGIPNEYINATSRVSYLTTPKELLEMSENYNELVISVPNSLRIESEFDDMLEKPRPLAIYCYDDITLNDVASARALGVGIILVDTKAYEIEHNNRLKMADTMSKQVISEQKEEYDYLKPGDKDEFDR